jgi:hypothetical protein
MYICHAPRNDRAEERGERDPEMGEDELSSEEHS